MLLAVLTLQELPGFRGTVECSYCQGIFPTVPVQSLFSAPSPCADVHHLWSTHTCASTLHFWNPTNSLKSLRYNNFFSQSSIVPLSSHIFKFMYYHMKLFAFPELCSSSFLSFSPLLQMLAIYTTGAAATSPGLLLQPDTISQCQEPEH